MSFRLILGFSLLLFAQSALGQHTGEKCKYVKLLNEPVSLDSLSVIPGSVTFPKRDGLTAVHNLSDGTVVISAPSHLDSVYVCFKVLPYSLHKRYFNRSLAQYDSNAIFKDKRPKREYVTGREELFPTEGINKSGTLSRGISFGNNQDVFVNSTLNLNLEGKLTDELNILASITDQNVPYQPEGNTQQLQDFDNVFIKIFNDKFSLTGGDVVLQSKPSNFLKYYKNVQGGLASLDYKLGAGKATTQVGISVAKGQFNSVQIEAIEGQLGPYRIPGPNGQPFTIVLANSEKVFIDGQRMERGFNKDYVIDYNSGLLTFNPSVLITEFTRIRVDYEYSDQNYNRSIATASHYQTAGKLSLFTNAYSEKDSRNRPLLVDLSNNDKQLLSTIGDDFDRALISGVDSIAFNNRTVLYEKKDTVDLSGIPTSIFLFSTNPESAFFRITFSDVGQNKGNYILDQGLTNGRVYKWISPVDGEPQGQFEPTLPVPLPNKKQMTTLGASYQLSKYDKVFTEVAFSSFDRNLFSELDGNDDNGYAIKSGVATEGRPLSFLEGYKLNASIDFEYDNKNFNPIDRFRYIEYDRDWSYNPAEDTERFSDQIFNAQFALKKDNNNSFSYLLSQRNRGEQINGIQHKIDFAKSIGKVSLKSSLFNLNNNQADQKSTWERFITDLSYQNKLFVSGYRCSFDHNQVKVVDKDSVSSSAMYFDEHTLYFRNVDEAKLKFDISHAYRKDQRPLEGNIADYSTSNTTQLRLAQVGKINNVDLTFIYRQQDFDLIDDLSETISGRINWSGNWLNRHINSQLTYSIANSSEPRREFLYILVPAGQGTHTWRDLNGDEVQDLNEFFEAINPDERNYAKIFVPSTEFITAFQNLFNYRVRVDAPRQWRKAKGVKRFVSRFSNNTSWSSDIKTIERNIGDRAFAFVRNIDDNSLLGEVSNLRSTLFFNRANSTYGVDLSLLKQQRKQQLTNGFESRSTDQYSVNMRLNLARKFALKVRNSITEKVSESDFLTDRNYLLDQYRINPEFSWQPKNNFRISLQYSYLNKENNLTLESNESAILNELKTELKINKAVKSSINASFRWVNIDFTGVENSSLGYELLDALRPGQNITWNLNWLQKVTKGLQLNMTYDGRKSEGGKVIHVGRVQVSALF